MGYRGRGVAALLVVGLVVGSEVRGQAPSHWVGKKVVIRYRHRIEREFRVYQVEQVDGDRLRLAAGGISGWVDADDVVPFDQSIDFYTREIRANPRAAHAFVRRGLIWEVKGERDRALADYDEAIRLDPKAQTFLHRGHIRRDKGEHDKALDDYNEAVRLDGSSAAALNARAWLWATCPDEVFRDGKWAIESATLACLLTSWKEPNCLGTLAAAYAEAGDFEKAVEWQEKANKRYPDAKDKKAGEERLKLYQARKPYREKPGR